MKSIKIKLQEKENDDISSRLIIQLLKPESEHSFALSVSNKKANDQIVCIDELKISLLAKSCMCRGIISLISMKPMSEIIRLSKWWRITATIS